MLYFSTIKKKDGNPAICHNMNESGRPFAVKCAKTQKDKKTAWSHLCEKSEIVKLIYIDKVDSGLGEGENRDMLVKSTKGQSYKVSPRDLLYNIMSVV